MAAMRAAQHDNLLLALVGALVTITSAAPVLSGSLISNVNVAKLDANGAIVMPHGIKRVIVEIGCSDHLTLDEGDGQGPQLHDDPEAFLISFEPLLEKWAALLVKGPARFYGVHGRQKNKVVPLGYHHRRGVVLPYAVSEHAGVQTFNVSTVSSCSSLVRMNHSNNWGRACLDTLEERQVDAITLQTALALAGGLPISYLKIDAQGMDFRILATTPRDVLRSVSTIRLETMADASRCTELMRGKGFE